MTLSYSQFDARRALDRNGAALPVYGVWGDAYLQDLVVAQLIEWSLGDGERDFNFDQLDGDSSKIADVLAACANLPFLSDKRVVLVKRAEKLEGLARGESDSKKKKSDKGGASPAQRLTAGLESLPPTTTLILARTPETPEAGDRAGERCINANLDKVIEAQGLLVNCALSSQNAGQVVALISEQAKAQGLTLERDAAAFLVARCGVNVAFLLSELEKCALRAGIGKPISRAVIEDMTNPSLQDSIFALTDAIGSRNGARALALTREMIERGHSAEELQGRIVGHLRKLLQARAVLDAGFPLAPGLGERLSPALREQFPSEGSASLLNASPYTFKSLGDGARHFSLAQLTRALELAFETDMAMKGIEGDGGFESKVNSNASLEIFVTKLCG